MSNRSTSIATVKGLQAASDALVNNAAHFVDAGDLERARLCLKHAENTLDLSIGAAMEAGVYARFKSGTMERASKMGEVLASITIAKIRHEVHGT